MMCLMNRFLSRTLIDARERKQQANVSGATGAIPWLSQSLESLLWLIDPQQYKRILSNGKHCFPGRKYGFRTQGKY